MKKDFEHRLILERHVDAIDTDSGMPMYPTGDTTKSVLRAYDTKAEADKAAEKLNAENCFPDLRHYSTESVPKTCK